MRIFSDEMLARAVRWPGFRRAAARRAAARQLHEVALASAPDDAVVLALLGMHAAARDAAGGGRALGRARMLAEAAFGAAPDPEALAVLDARWRRRIAGAIAPHDALRAESILPPEDSLARAACRYAAGEDVGMLIAGSRDREAHAIGAGIAIDDGNFEGARGCINALFAGDALSPPLDDRGDGFDIASFGERRGERVPAGGEGPLVSMIVPVRDGAETIAIAVRSIARQSWRAIEIVIVDDGSTDASGAIAAQLAQEDPRIRVIANTGPAGVAGARNTGVAAARGRWIGFLDADDWAHPERIARQAAMLATGAAASVSHHIRIDARGRPVAPRVFPIVRLCPISMLVDADALGRAGPFEIARTGSDAEMLARLDVVIGRRRIRRDRALLTVASWRPASLSSDAAHGMFAADRFAYREDWMRRHAARAGLPSGSGAP
jgi:hypothetical protein